MFFSLGARRSRLVVSACTDPGDSEKEKPEKNDKFCSVLDGKKCLQAMLRKAAKALEQNKEFTAEQAHNYHMSVTEREVISIYLYPNIQREEMSSPK